MCLSWCYKLVYNTLFIISCLSPQSIQLKWLHGPIFQAFRGSKGKKLQSCLAGLSESSWKTGFFQSCSDKMQTVSQNRGHSPHLGTMVLSHMTGRVPEHTAGHYRQPWDRAIWSKGLKQTEAWGVATILSQNHFSIPEVTQSHALRKKPHILKVGSQQTFKMLLKSTNRCHVTRPTVWMLAIRCLVFSGQVRHGDTGCKDKYL